MSSGSLAETTNSIYDWLEVVEGAGNFDPTQTVLEDAVPFCQREFACAIRRGRKRTRGNMQAAPDLGPVPNKKRMFVVPSPSLFDDGQSSALSSNATRSRSSSPAKRKRDLQFARPRITFRQGGLMERRQELEEQVPLLRDLLATVSQAQKELPVNLKNFLHERTDELSGIPLPPFTESAKLSPFGDIEPNLREIVAETRFCQDMEATEDEWCHRVVYPILNLAAKKLTKELPPVDIATVKAINISPTTLLPTNHQGDKPQGKRVDYAVGVNILRTYQPKLVQTISEAVTTRTFSQSDHPRVAELVMFSQFEVKRKLNARDGDIQLGVWCAAGIKKLEQLWWDRRPMDLATVPSIPAQDQPQTVAVMPLWLWTDETVLLYVAIKTSPEDIEIFTVSQWSCAQEAGLARLVITLTWIMEWGCSKYLEWWKRYLALHEILVDH